LGSEKNSDEDRRKVGAATTALETFALKLFRTLERSASVRLGLCEHSWLG